MKKCLLVFGFVLAGSSSTFAASCTTPNSITKLRNLHVGLRDYVDIYIKAPMTGIVDVRSVTGPNFEVEGDDGTIITVSGNRWTQVTFHYVDSTCDSVTAFVLPRPIVKDIKNVEQFEGWVSYAIGRWNGHYLGHSWTMVGGQKRLRLTFGP